MPPRRTHGESWRAVCARALEFASSPDHPLVKALLKNVETVTGEKKSIGGKDGSTDAHIINAKLGIPAVIFGPGEFTLCHRPNEHISLKHLEQAAQSSRGPER